MSDAHLELPACPKCRAASGIGASGFHMRCALCGEWWMATAEEDAQYARARSAWLKIAPPHRDYDAVDLLEQLVQRRAAEERGKLARLAEGRW